MKKDSITIALVQTNITWEDKMANVFRMRKALASIPPDSKVDLVIFPELMTTGFSMRADELAEAFDGPTMQAVAGLSCEYDVAIASSVLICDTERYYNRGYIVHPNGRMEYQDKRHLFRMGGEPDVISPSLERRIIDFHGWRILLTICYDLRFPVWCRNAHNEYDVLINVANWPEPRADVYDILLRARAMENAAYVIGVNRVGSDAHGLPHKGGSVAVNPRGELICSFSPDEEGVRILSIEHCSLDKFRRKFPAWKDADSFAIDIITNNLHT